MVNERKAQGEGKRVTKWAVVPSSVETTTEGIQGENQIRDFAVALFQGGVRCHHCVAAEELRVDVSSPTDQLA